MNPFTRFSTAAMTVLVCLASPPARAGEIVTLNTPRTFPKLADQAAWLHRAGEIRAEVLASCGLWPMPERTPLNPQLSGRIDRADYSIEKVVIETHPGVFLAGNLFRPVRQTQSRYPGILNPHGHWENGRMANTETGSIAARCIQFARMGMVAFAYDMVGYNDTTQFSPRKADGTLEFPKFYDGHVRFAQAPEDQIWGISLMGLQTWNSIRALDFLASLPDVDPGRLACTGESGGGTQTFMLGAIDSRLTAQAPIVMVSHTMQGGCWCENAPGLRVRFSNMEIAASAAPRPQLLVAATGDWTRDTPTVEGPAIAGVYHLFGPGQQFRFEQFDFPHNYNQTSREVAYAFMAEHLQGRARAPKVPEQAYQMEIDRHLRLWADDHLPPGAKSSADFKAYLKDQTRRQLAALWNTTAAGSAGFKEQLSPIYRAVFQLSPDPQEIAVQVGTTAKLETGIRVSQFEVRGEAATHAIPVRVAAPAKRKGKRAIILAHPLGMSAAFDQAGKPTGIAARLLEAGQTIITFDSFLTGGQADSAERAKRDHFKDFFSTYNRTDLQERVSDLVAISAFARSHLRDYQIVFCGQEAAGLWCLLAASAADAVAADTIRFDANDDRQWTQQDWLIPSIQRLGGFDGPTLLAAPHPLLLHNAGDVFPTKIIADNYQRFSVTTKPAIHKERLDDAAVAKWLVGL